MKFYVAGSSKLIGWAQLAMALVEQAGHTVTQDWTKHFEPGARQHFAGDLARQDLEGVARADAVIFIFLFMSEVVMSSSLEAAIQLAEYAERTGNLALLGRGGNVAYRNYLATMPRSDPAQELPL